MKLKLIICSLTLLTLTGCALTNATKIINYKHSFVVDQKLGENTKLIKIEKMIDKRGYGKEGEKIIFYKRNLYDEITSGKYFAEEPIVDILTKAVENGLKEKGILHSFENGQLKLQSTLQSFDYDVITGFTHVELIPKITVKFQLIDSEDNIIWTETLQGKIKTKGARFEKFIPPAIDDLVLSLINNPQFLKAIKQ